MSVPYTEEMIKAVDAVRRHAQDTGSSEAQIALLTQRIEHLNKQHFSANKKDFAGKRGLLRLVNLRRTQLAYLKRVNPQRHAEILVQLDLRK